MVKQLLSLIIAEYPNLLRWPNTISARALAYAVQRAPYEVKNNCYLFKMFFRVKKNGFFLFGISFFVLEIFTNDTYYVVAMATLFAPVSFCEKNKFPHLPPFEVGQRVLLGTHMVPILS